MGKDIGVTWTDYTKQSGEETLWPRFLTSTSLASCDTTEHCNCTACSILGPVPGLQELWYSTDQPKPESPRPQSTLPVLVHTDCLLNKPLLDAGGGMPTTESLPSSSTSFMDGFDGASFYNSWIDTLFGSNPSTDLFSS